MAFSKGDISIFHKLAKFRGFLLGEDGPTAVEYAVMLVMIILVCIAVVSSLGTQAKGLLSSANSSFSASS